MKRVCIVDLEATCDNTVQNYDHEIIEIGAMICSEDGNKIFGTYDRFIKPVRSKLLTDFCKRLTTITQEQVDLASGYTTVMEDFIKWMTDFSSDNTMDSLIFSSWGHWDKKMFLKESKYHEVDYPFAEPHLNIKQLFKDKMDRQHASVNKALRILGMEFIGIPHRALEDVVNIHRILKALHRMNNT